MIVTIFTGWMDREFAVRISIIMIKRSILVDAMVGIIVKCITALKVRIAERSTKAAMQRKRRRCLMA